MERSPSKKTATRWWGKTIKDYEEEVTELRRDNYELRLRIYLMEEEQEGCVVDDGSEEVPRAFSNVREIYLRNSHLKSEVEELKNQISQKDEKLEEATKKIEDLRKKFSEQLNSLKCSANKEKESLENRIALLTKVMEDVKLTKCHPAETEIGDGVLNNTSYNCAIAFDLTLPQRNSPKQESSCRSDSSSLEAKVNYLEEKLRSEQDLNVDMEGRLDVLKEDVNRLKDGRRLIGIELKKKEMDLTNALRLIEEKCSVIESLQNTIEGLKKMLLQTNHQAALPYSKESDEGLSDLEKQVVILQRKLKEKEVEVESVRCENMKALRTIQGFVKQNKALRRDLEMVKSSAIEVSPKGEDRSSLGRCESSREKDNCITELENQIALMNEQLSVHKECLSKEQNDQLNEATSQILNLKNELKQKKKEIDHLNEKLRKSTFNLQEIVNKELWNKNREIEKLNKLCERKDGEISSLNEKLQIYCSQTKGNEVFPFSITDFKENQNPNGDLVSNIFSTKLNEELKTALDENKSLKEEIISLNDKVKEKIKECEDLKADCDRYKEDYDESEKTRKELVNACTLLTTRLEELSTFLESLLPSLGIKKRLMLQQAIDKSREMSRSFSFVDNNLSTLSIPLLPDVSQVDFCSGDELSVAKASFIEKFKCNEGSKFDNSLWSLADMDLGKLEDITEGSLLDTIDSETSVAKTVTPGSGQRKRASVSIVTQPAEEIPTESDGGWSEPDLNVSKQRLGIKENTRSPNLNSSEESSRSIKKTHSAKKNRNECMSELRRLSSKLDNVMQMYDALQIELFKLQKSSNIKLRKVSNGSLLAQIEEMSFQLEKSCHLCLELEGKCSRLDEEKRSCEEKLLESEEKLRRVTSDYEAALAVIKEKETVLLEKQCCLLDTSNQVLLIKAKAESLSDQLKDKENQVNEYEKETIELKKRIELLEKESSETFKRLKETEAEYKGTSEKIQKELEEEIEKRIEAEKKLCNAYVIQKNMSDQLEEESLKAKEVDSQLKLEQQMWRRKLGESESREAELRKKLDRAVVTTSEAVLERTRLANERLRLQHRLRASESSHFAVIQELESRIAELEAASGDGEGRPEIARQDPLGSCSSPTLSPPLSPRQLGFQNIYLPQRTKCNYRLPGITRSNNNSSPDLGIESDHHSLARTHSYDLVPSASHGDLSKLESENLQLRCSLQKYRKAFEDTLSQLTTANKKKKQVEKAVCKQIHLTHNILRQAKVNLDPSDSH